MARRKNGTSVPKPTVADQRLASAIADAVGPRFELLGSKLDGMSVKLDDLSVKIEGVRDEVRQLREATVGVGRVLKLEQRVDELERKSR